ncbi:uncharacterized protein HKW66_Vig0200410 [Vigna angularis]|nr:uncharacterized protein HKW66_Vig0200410 [Vigna angularis]
MPNSVGCARLCCNLSMTVLVWSSSFAGFETRDESGGFGMDETREVEARSGFRIWVIVYWIEVDACQDIKDDGDDVEEIGVFTVENGGEDELSRVLSIVAIWVVDGRTKEFSQWSEVAHGGPRLLTVVRQWR